MSTDAHPAVTWKAEPDEHDYPAAASYLALVATPTQVVDLVERLKTAPVQHFKAKDMLRAAGLALLPVDDPHVAADLAKVDKGRPLSPVLIEEGSLVRRGCSWRPRVPPRLQQINDRAAAVIPHPFDSAHENRRLARISQGLCVGNGLPRENSERAQRAEPHDLPTSPRTPLADSARPATLLPWSRR